MIPKPWTMPRSMKCSTMPWMSHFPQSLLFNLFRALCNLPESLQLRLLRLQDPSQSSLHQDPNNQLTNKQNLRLWWCNNSWTDPKSQCDQQAKTRNCLSWVWLHHKSKTTGKSTVQSMSIQSAKCKRLLRKSWLAKRTINWSRRRKRSLRRSSEKRSLKNNNKRLSRNNHKSPLPKLSRSRSSKKNQLSTRNLLLQLNKQSNNLLNKPLSPK